MENKLIIKTDFIMFTLKQLPFLLFLPVLVAIAGCASSSTSSSSSKDNAAAKPNILILLADQWAGEAVGYSGQEIVTTPNIDALANESLVLKQMVCTCLLYTSRCV